MDSLTLKVYSSFQNENDRKYTHTVLLPNGLINNLQQEVLNINDICMIWSSTNTDLVTSFIKPRKMKFCEPLNSNFSVNIWHSFT